MPRVQRSHDVIEIHWENAIWYGLLGIAGIAGWGILYRYRGEGLLLYIGWCFFVAGLISLGYAVRRAIMVRDISEIPYVCPFCGTATPLTDVPTDDFACPGCNRMVPIKDGKVLKVDQVRCGYCNELNYYSEKTEILVCEKCDHEIPITLAEGQVSTKTLPKFYAVSEDDALYELILIAHGSKTEELIKCLQQMLALNRTQVKQMLGELPVTLLTGITRRKAEILQAQLNMHEGAADIRALN